MGSCTLHDGEYTDIVMLIQRSTRLLAVVHYSFGSFVTHGESKIDFGWYVEMPRLIKLVSSMSTLRNPQLYLLLLGTHLRPSLENFVISLNGILHRSRLAPDYAAQPSQIKHFKHL